MLRSIALLSNDIIYNINTYQGIPDIVNLYSCDAALQRIYSAHRPLCEIRSLLDSNNVLKKTACNYSKAMRKIFSKYYNNNIPSTITSIDKYLKWVYIFKKILRYYNVSFFSNDTILFTSSTETNIYNIHKCIYCLIYKDYSDKKFTILEKLARERNITRDSKRVYHQLEYEQLVYLVLEICNSSPFLDY
tara:strand:- start:712 stop:1281 length:570 start_codon:yes stop_codon:yes gene_type:complete